MSKPLDVISEHECEVLEKYNNRLHKIHIAIQKYSDGSWYWIQWNDKRNTANGISYCPYCGQKL